MDEREGGAGRARDRCGAEDWAVEEKHDVGGAGFRGRVCMWRVVAGGRCPPGAITPTYYSLYNQDVFLSMN